MSDENDGEPDLSRFEEAARKRLWYQGTEPHDLMKGISKRMHDLNRFWNIASVWCSVIPVVEHARDDNREQLFSDEVRRRRAHFLGHPVTAS